jgi:nucleoside-diphosphate-sugar epimerase
MYPARFESEEQLEEFLSSPSIEDVEFAHQVEGDIVLLGAAGKMGPTLAGRVRRALDAAGSRARVVAVSRFSEEGARERMESFGVECVASDLMAEGALGRLPDAANVIYMAARKFGSTGSPGQTWATNVVLPALAAGRYRGARIVAFSTGNVYPFTAPESGGPTERVAPDPVGEYGWTALGRERVFEYVSGESGTPVALLRLNYAVEPRYGVLADIALKVWQGTPVNVAMGYVNVIWQGDANSVAFRALGHCASPPFVLNLTGGETLRVRDLAEGFGRRLGKEPVIEGEEAPTALLSNASLCERLFGRPEISVDLVMGWVAEWVRGGGRSLGKPTKFQVRDGKF